MCNKSNIIFFRVNYMSFEVILTSEYKLTSILESKKEQLVSLFIDSLDLTYNSKETYRRCLRQFMKWTLSNNIELQNLTRESIIAYKNSLFEKGMSSLSVSAYINSVRLFFEYCEASKVFPNIAKGIRSPKRKRAFRKQPLSLEQGKKLLEFMEASDLRDRAIINLLLRTGLRTIEVVRANIEDLTYKGGQRVLLVHGKGRSEKDNFVILTDKTYKSIEDYLASRTNILDRAPLFTSGSNNNKGERLTTRTISFIAKENLKNIGINGKEYTAHSLRHTTAVNILRAGGTLENAQHTLRHSSPLTTQIYTETLEEERRLLNSGEALLDAMY